MAVRSDALTLGSDSSARAGEARWLTDALLLLMAVIWGVNFSVLKYGTQFVAPLAFNGLRIPLAAGAQLGIAGAMRLPPVDRRVVWRLIALGMLGNGVYQVLFILGIVRTRVATAALIVAATPAFIAILGRLVGAERLSRRNWIGIACQVAGCSSVVIGSARGGEGSDSLAGGAMILGASFSWAVYSILLRRHAHSVHTVHLGAWTMVGGALVSCVVAIPSLLATQWSTLPAGVWLAVLYSGLFAMVLAYLFWYRGLRILGATRTAVYSNLQPVFAAVVAFLVLHEVPSLPQYAGAALVVTGLLLTRR